MLAVYTDQRGRVLGVETVETPAQLIRAVRYAIDHWLALDLVDQDAGPHSQAIRRRSTSDKDCQ